MLLSEFDYDLPHELIAQEPLEDRAGARMLVLDRKTGTWEDRMFRDFPSYVGRGDCMVLNDSRVFPSRLYGVREHGSLLTPRTTQPGAAGSQPALGRSGPAPGAVRSGKVEVFLTRPISPDGFTWEALVHPGRKMRTGERVLISEDLTAEILGRGEFGERSVRLHPNGDLFAVLDRVGHVPLPPYIKRPDTETDRTRYQTVYASERGSVAAPTAGLHFTPEILDACRAAGAEIARVTLHVGLGTFQPLRTDVLEEVHLHKEFFTVPDETWQAMQRASRVVAVGTTSVRAIESDPSRHETELFIYPGFNFRHTGAMLTNFHLPRSSLLVLVCAFAGKDLALAAYRHAVERNYRFFSYGDCMLVL